MDILFHVTAAEARPMLMGLAESATRAGLSWGCFLTHDGVKSLRDGHLCNVLTNATRAVVCEHSWDIHMAGCECPAELGSQTINSGLIAEAVRVISL